MAKKTESEVKEGDGAKTAAGDVSAPAPHADEQQDVALFKKMISQHLGQEHVDNAEALEMAKSMHEACVESGMGSEEAYESAGRGLKVSYLLGKKKKEAVPAGTANATSVAKADDVKGPAVAKTEEASADGSIANANGTPIDAAAGDAAGVRKAVVHESERKLLEATAENVKLKEALRARDMADHLEKTLRESKLPTQATKAFRELVKDVKTTAEVDSRFATFKEAFTGLTVDSGRELIREGFGFAVEKNAVSTTDTGNQVSGFGDCK